LLNTIRKRSHGGLINIVTRPPTG